MTKPWTVLVAGTSGLLALALIVKEFRSADSPGSATSRQRVESFAAAQRTEHSGWTAREDADSPQAAGGGTHRSTASGGVSGQRGGAAFGEGKSPSERNAARIVGGGGGRQAASIGHRPGSTYAASDAIHAETGVPAIAAPAGGSGPFHDPHGQTEVRMAGNQAAAGTSGGPADSASNDPNSPVLSLSFNNSTQPDKGSAPLIEEGVSCGDQGCTFDTNSRFAIPDAANLSGDAGSISFCLQPQWAGTDPSNAGLVDLQTPNRWDNQMNIFKNGGYFRLRMIPNSGVETGVSARINNWEPGQTHAVTAAYGPDPTTGENMVWLYLDGNLAGQSPYQGQLEVPQQPLYIGSDFPGGQPGANATLSTFQAYNRVQTADEAANFAAGCPQ